MSTDIAQFLWVEGRLSTMEQLCLTSFLNNAYEVHLYTYGVVTDIPQGVTVKDGRKILPYSRIFQSEGSQGRNSSYTAFADLFRLALLSQRGGWWFDMDMICLQHLPPPKALMFASTWEGEYGQCVSNCAIWSPAADPALTSLYESCNQLVLQKQSNLGFGECGVHLLKHFIHGGSFIDAIAPWWEFCPYPWRLVHRLAQRTLQEYAKDRLRGLKHRMRERIDQSFKAAYPRAHSRTLHFHNEIWQAMGYGKDERFFKLSDIEVYKKRSLRSR